MSDILSLRKQIIFCAMESGGYGVDAVPTDNSILCGNISINPLEGESVQRNIVRPHMGSQGSIRVSNYVKLSFECEWAGSGTAGGAPKIATLLKMCNITEQLMPAAITGTAQAGGSINSIKLAAGDQVPTDGFFVGMPIRIIDGTASGYVGRITAYISSTNTATITGSFSAQPDATSAYSIDANAIYLPNSNSALAANTSGTLYFYLDGTRHILLGARGTFKPSLKASAIPAIQFEFTGLLGTIADVALPAADFSGWQAPVPVGTTITSDVSLFTLRNPVFEECAIDHGNDVKFKSLINEQAVRINDRAATMTFTTRAQKMATIDWYAQIRNSSTGIFSVRHGNVAGNTVGVFCPKVQPKTISFADDDKTANHQIAFDILPTDSGNNEIMYIFE